MGRLILRLFTGLIGALALPLALGRRDQPISSGGFTVRNMTSSSRS